MPNQSLLFSDSRLLLYNESEVGANVGLGYRVYNPIWDCVWGIYVYYDNRHTGLHGFEQLSAGAEVLGPRCDFRANVYLPSVFSNQKPLPSQFWGHYFLIDRTEVALTGFDTELGLPLPAIRCVEPRVALGAYHYEGPDAPSFWGGRVRIEACVRDTVSMDLSVQSDSQFDTTVNFGVAWRFPGIRPCTRCWPAKPWRSPCERLWTPVERQQNIAVTEHGEFARDPGTGDPIFFLHVGPGGNSDGSFEDPYPTLADALADPRYLNGEADVIYVRQNPAAPLVHTGNVVFQPNTQLLSNGPAQWIDNQFGLALLPYSGSDVQLAALPRIVGDVTMDDDTTLSGFEVHGGVVADGVSDVTITRNGVTESSAIGIYLRNTQGALRIVGNFVSANEAQGLGVEDSDAVFDIGDNTFRDNGSEGVFLEDSTLVGDIAGNVIEGNGATGLRIDGCTLSGDITENTLSSNDLYGLSISGTAFTGDVDRNQANDNDLSGIQIANSALGSFVGNITNNECQNNGSRGIWIGNWSPVPGDVYEVNIVGNVFNGNSAEGVFLGGAQFIGDIRENSADGNSLWGMFIHYADVTGNLTANSASSNTYPGIYLDQSTLVGDVVGNTFSNNRTTGFYSFYSHLTGNLVGNTINGNALYEGIELYGSTLIGNIADSMISSNGGYGIQIQNSTMVGDIARNTLENNNEPGVYFRNYSGTSIVHVIDNYFSGNNEGVRTEFIARSDDSGTLYLELDGNTSTNTGPVAYNYYLIAGQGDFFLKEGDNVGIVGAIGTDPWVP